MDLTKFSSVFVVAELPELDHPKQGDFEGRGMKNH